LNDRTRPTKALAASSTGAFYFFTKVRPDFCEKIMNKFVIWTSAAVGLVATVVLLANPAFAALTFSDTGVSSSGVINLDGAGAVSVGTSAATSVVIGKTGITTTINGSVGIGTASPAVRWSGLSRQ
jgi:hypothetical protein